MFVLQELRCVLEMHLERGCLELLYFVDTIEISMGHVLVLRCVTITNYSVDVCHEIYLY